jgi:glutamyl-Q tRNA(Asp) synthetase
MSTPPVLRFAPSPTGRLHLGHARSALLAHDLACRWGGQFLLRIEDIDTTRAHAPFVDAIFEDLAWLGIRWPSPVLRQSQHLAVYRAAADQLSAMGLLYPCFASRAEIAAAAVPGERDPDGAPIHPGPDRVLSRAEHARRAAANAVPTLRLATHAALSHVHALGVTELTYEAFAPDGRTTTMRACPERWGDVVVVRKDVATSYHLSVVVDDARQGVTHVTRGADLHAATDVHRLLQVLLGLPAPMYHHHALVLDAAGRKLSKSDGAVPLSELRAGGATPHEIRRMVAVEMP